MTVFCAQCPELSARTWMAGLAMADTLSIVEARQVFAATSARLRDSKLLQGLPSRRAYFATFADGACLLAELLLADCRTHMLLIGSVCKWQLALQHVSVQDEDDRLCWSKSRLQGANAGFKRVLEHFFWFAPNI